MRTLLLTIFHLIFSCFASLPSYFFSLLHSKPPKYVPHASYHSVAMNRYYEELETYLEDSSKFNDFTSKDIVKENAKHLTIQV
jgi:hypothetical protein